MLKIGDKTVYSIGEKKNHYNKVLNDPNASAQRKAYAKRRLVSLDAMVEQIELGDVYVVDDRDVGNPNSKPRVVVATEKKR